MFDRQHAQTCVEAAVAALAVHTVLDTPVVDLSIRVRVRGLGLSREGVLKTNRGY